MKMDNYFDVLIIGSGSAGLTAAISLAKYCKVAILSKGPLSEGSTFYAQGGIAAAIHPKDSLESHIKDTIKAGAGLCNPEIVSFVIKKAPNIIDWLISKGVTFSEDLNKDRDIKYHLNQEGGHSYRRILHSNDSTGKEIETKLIRNLKSLNIEIFEEHTAIDLIKHKNRCTGAYVLDNKSNKVVVIQSKFVILATGGASKAYLYTSNPDCSSGDGIAMGARIGCNITNMEFNQFHPTCLYHPHAKSFLITETIRGEGGKLILPNGESFMEKFDRRKELAPRDIVARAIDYEIKLRGIDCIYLDISHKSAKFIKTNFPNVYNKCKNFGFDITKEPIPVVPAAHYTCGGIATDKKGQTNISGLYAIGEVACTGLNGANRIASNSLLECIVLGISCSDDIKNKVAQISLPKKAPSWDESQVTNSEEEIVVTHNWNEIRYLMWDYVGIVRTNKRLERATRRINVLKKEIHEYYENSHVTKNLIELRNLCLVAELIINSAIKRKENIGLHYNLDYIK